MRTEYREITVKQNVYIADDGKEFIDADECEAYELNLVKEKLMGYDSSGEKVDDLDDCTVVYLRTYEDVRNYIHWSDAYGYDWENIDKPGIYMYTCDNEWINLEEIISKIRGVTND